jgi:dTMP kinase
MARSLFISFEGPEGAGKTTQVELLRQHLLALGKDVLVTRQPGGEAVGQQLRKIMLERGQSFVSPRAELLLMMADRAQSVETVIQPQLDRLGVVICDRYADSSVAYQGAGRGLDRQIIDDLNSFATAGLQPDLTFLLDIDPIVGLDRQRTKTKMEMEDITFHDRVRSAYLELATTFPQRIHVVDASQPIGVVQSQIQEVFDLYETSC